MRLLYLTSSDVIPPQVVLTSFPSLVSNVTRWTFTYGCIDQSGCSFSCSSHEVGDPPLHSPCGSPYHVDGLLDGHEYELELIATDGVGNIGQLVVHRWKIGEC